MLRELRYLLVKIWRHMQPRFEHNSLFRHFSSLIT
ncbi:hypothetical protein Leryth_008469, partial [Lithospermum erythrorhizon]